MTTCRHCLRDIIWTGAAWIDPEAEGDDRIWRYSCDANDTFFAEHEPTEEEPPS